MAEINVRDFGAAGSGSVDDWQAFHDALAALESEGGGTLYVPTGVYPLGRHDTASALWIKSNKPIRVRGDGQGASVIQMLAGSYVGDFYLFRCETAGFELTDLTLDGNKQNIPTSDEQTHLLHVLDSKHVVARNVEFRSSRGDGIKVFGSGGSTGKITDDVSVGDCVFRDNRRSGITIQRALQNVRIHGCLFTGTSDQDIDFEPSGGPGPRQIVIKGNIFQRTLGATPASVTLSGDVPDRSDSVVFEGNIIAGGMLSAVHAKNLIISNNVITPPPGKRCIEITRDVENILIEGNLLSNAGAEGIIISAAAGQAQPADIIIRGNRVTTSAFSGICLESVAGAVVSGNRVTDPTGIGFDGIRARATLAGAPCRNIQIDGNSIEGFSVGVKVTAQNADCLDISVALNNIANRFGAANKKGVVFETLALPSTFKCLRVGAVGNHAGAGIFYPLVGLTGVPGQSVEGNVVPV